jgi:hypothetical protein
MNDKEYDIDYLIKDNICPEEGKEILLFIGSSKIKVNEIHCHPKDIIRIKYKDSIKEQIKKAAIAWKYAIMHNNSKSIVEKIINIKGYKFEVLKSVGL